MIKVLDQNDRELYKYKLLSGENKFGSDPKQCQFFIRNVQPVLFSVALINKDVYFTHFSEEQDVYKESTLKSTNKVHIPKKFPIELIPGRNYYFQNYKFCLIDILEENPIMHTQIIEEFSGTLQLDDILEQPSIQQPKISTTQLFAATQVLGSQEFCCPTLVIDDCQDKQIENNIQTEIASLQDLFSQYSISKSSINSTMQDSYTQTDPIEQVTKPSIFGSLFSSKPQQQYKYQPPPQQQNVNKTQLESQMGATVEDDDQLHFFDKKENKDIAGTVIDEDLEKAFSSQQINIIQQKNLSQDSSIFKRVNSIISDQPQFSNSKVEQNSNIELNDLFGSLPDIPQQQIVQPQIIKKISSLKSNLFQIKQEDIQEEKTSFQDTPKKNNFQNHKDTEKKKGKKKKEKDHAKKGDILKKITDEISDESDSDGQEQKQEQKQKQIQINDKQNAIRQTNSMELPATKMFEEKGNGVVPKKRRGLRKRRLVSEKSYQYIAFSGFQESELPSEKQINDIGLEVVDNQYEKFDILIVKSPPKRTFKFLAALMLGAEIVTIDWLIDSIKHKEPQNHQDYIPENQEFVNQFGLSIKTILQSRDDHFESNDNTAKIFENKYLVLEDAIPSKTEIEYLIKLGGGEIVKRASKNVIIISENKKSNSLSSDFILDACMFQQ